MLVQLLILAAGLVLLLGGGELLVRGSSSLATRLGVNPTLIGLTVVAMGTSAPELIVCLLSAGRGEPDIAFGNVFGSNLANAGLLVGITALIAPFPVQSGIVRREMPLLLIGAILAMALGMDSLWDEQSTLESFGRGDGLALLMLFTTFLVFTLRDYVKSRGDILGEVVKESGVAQSESPGRIGAAVFFGLVGLVGGGELVVRSAIEVARGLEVPEVVIAVTVVSIGTSLPELVTCVASARKDLPDLALGNVVGSNLFNLLLVLSCTAIYKPVPLPEGAYTDLIANLLVSVAILFIALRGRDVTRKEGSVLLVGYAVYVALAVGR